MTTIISGGTIVNEGRSFKGSVVIDGENIAAVIPEENELGHEASSHSSSVAAQWPKAKVIDATGCLVLPGVIDEHVHFREPGMTEKADIESESRAAAFGGVTSYMEMPNTKPQTTTLDAWHDKMDRAAAESHVNYSFFYGATNDNADTFRQLDRTRLPGIKLFMGASTGNMLVDQQEALDTIFSECARLDLPLMTHCEDSAIIQRNMEEAQRRWGDDPPVQLHPAIRSREACVASTRLAVSLAAKHGTRLHVAHLSTAEELDLLADVAGKASSQAVSLVPDCPKITGEAVIAHLLFSDADYDSLGARIKCNPAVKSAADRTALRAALRTDGAIFTVATDHAPHLLAQKQGGCCRAASGMPMVQFSLIAMLSLVDEGVLTAERLVRLMCHNPARLFDVSGRGFLRPGFKADIAIVEKVEPWTLTADDVQSKCGWSPLGGRQFGWRVRDTFCNGRQILADGQFDQSSVGKPLRFRM